MNWDLLRKAININGVTNLIVNKVDVLEKIGRWELLYEDKPVRFALSDAMKGWLTIFSEMLPTINNVTFSGNKETI